MKALTLWQPWASLIALRWQQRRRISAARPLVAGVKTIETRSWSTKYRGPLAIHAGTRQPKVTEVRPFAHALGLSWCAIGRTCSPCEVACGECSIAAVRSLPLGSVLATSQLVDVVPIVHLGEETAVRRIEVGTMAGAPNLMLCAPDPGPDVISDLDRGFDKLMRSRLDLSAGDPEPGVDFDASDYYERDVTNQLPYGDFTPGRFAWLLADVVPLDPPVPAKGRQGLWEWSP